MKAKKKFIRGSLFLTKTTDELIRLHLKAPQVSADGLDTAPFKQPSLCYAITRILDGLPCFMTRLTVVSTSRDITCHPNRILTERFTYLFKLNTLFHAYKCYGWILDENNRDVNGVQ